MATISSPAGDNLANTARGAPERTGSPPPLPAKAAAPPRPPAIESAPPALSPGPPVPPVRAAAPPAPPAQSSAKPAPPAAEPVDQHAPLLESIRAQLPSWLASTVFHLGLMLALASFTVMEPLTLEGEHGDMIAQTGTFNPHGEKSEPLEEMPNEAPEAASELAVDKMVNSTEMPELGSRPVDVAMAPALPTIEVPFGLGGVGAPGISGEDGASSLLAGIGDPIGNSLRNRLSAGSRARMVALGGGTPGSETAVDRALKWLAEHQGSDGSWNYNHRAAPKCKGRCHDPGQQAQAKIAATAMALLPFLGTGETHHQGKYKKTIEQGLYFLVRSTHVEGDRAALLEAGGRMYGHGLASIVLCEAYGMTRDPWLEKPAQMAINFIVAAQDPVGGGWRYVPLQAGDTSVVGWQVMALKSAHMAYLRVPPETIRKAGYFLDSVQTAEGARYGYTGPGNGAAVTAIGLLSRMYMGWERERPALVQGVMSLDQMGPSLDKTGPPRNNMYYNYYATQVMHHFGGSEWRVWNVLMRDYLVKTQSDKGHEKGSWYFEGSDLGSSAGGRLYCTAMATMILEVYYRHMPLYTDLSTKDKFRD